MVRLMLLKMDLFLGFTVKHLTLETFQGLSKYSQVIFPLFLNIAECDL